MFITYWGRWRRLQGTQSKDDNMSWAAKKQGAVVSASTFSVFALFLFLQRLKNRFICQVVAEKQDMHEN